MIHITIVFFLIFAHFIFDFIFQTRWQAENKSKNMQALLNHVCVYAACFTLIFGPLFGLITFGFHFLTDYFTSKANAHFWVTNQIKAFWVCIGFDQFLHVFTLVLTYYWLFPN